MGVEADNKEWLWKGSVNYQFGFGLSHGVSVGQVWIRDGDQVTETHNMMGYILGKYIIISYVIFFLKFGIIYPLYYGIIYPL